jgi:hypothetical protein
MYKDNCTRCAHKLVPFDSPICTECRKVEDDGNGKFTKYAAQLPKGGTTA